MLGRQKPANEKLGIYIHIPFCRSKCDYCDFYSLAGQEGRMDDYQRAVLAHLKESAFAAKGYVVDTVYFGGGTPSFYGAKRLRELLSAVKKNYRVEKDAEVTLEANPDSADLKSLKMLRKAGFNRISIGLQSACPAELRAVRRPHTVEQGDEAVAAARKAGFANLSLDLIYGLPLQTVPSWWDTVEHALALEPDHLSCYGLKVEEGTPLFARREEAELPDNEAQADLYLCVVDYLSSQGYRQYEISNFAKEGFASRHNLKYWTLGEYMGFGPGAHSDLGGARYAYEKDLEGYIRGVRENGPLLSESDRIPPMDRDIEWLMLGLRTVYGLDPREFENRFRRRFRCFLPFLEKCREAGYAVCEEDRWHLTPRGFLVSNQIIGGVLDALAAEKRRRAEAAARGDFRVEN